MRRFWTVQLVLALTVLMAVPAGAAKPDRPGEPDPAMGMTCEETGALRFFDHVPVTWMDQEGKEYGEQTVEIDGEWVFLRSFTVVLNRHESACVDVTSVEGSWQVDIDLGTARSVGYGIADSVNPSDTCWRESVDTTQLMTTPTIPASTLNACDDGYNDFGDGDERLAFAAWYDGVRKLATPVTITVTLP